MRKRSIGAWLLVGAFATAACGVSAQTTAQTTADEDVPFGLLDHDVPPLLAPATATQTDTVSLCFVTDDRLVTTETRLDTPADLADVVEKLVEPPADAPDSLRSAVGAPPLVDHVRLTAGVAEVDLLPAIDTLGGAEQLLAVGQLTCTLTGQPGVGTVAFTLAGAPVDVPRGDGSLTSAPVSRDDYSELLD